MHSIRQKIRKRMDRKKENSEELFRKVWRVLKGEEEAGSDGEVREVVERMFRVAEMPALEEDRVWAQVERRIGKNGKRRGWGRVMRYAAAVMVPLWGVAAGYLLWSGGEGSRQEVSAYVRPQNAVVLTLASGERVALDCKHTGDFLVTDAVSIRQDSSCGLAYESRGEQTTELQYNVLDVPVATEYRLVMEDGTVVYLNADSRLKYPEVFTGGERKVYLEGEAYFEVAKDETRPFAVVAGGVEVRVLGTHFNVNAYPEKHQVTTTLVEGKVEVSSGKRHAVLSPGVQAVASEQGMKLQEVDVREYVGWKDGLFVFSRMPLEEIMRQVYRWYGVQAVFFSEEVRRMTFTGVINKAMSAEELFQVIEKVVHVRFTIGKDNQVVITPK